MPDLTTELTDTGKIKMNVISLNTAVNNLQEEMKTLNKVVIDGNGEPGLRETVRSDHAYINEIKSLTKFLIGLVMAQLVAFTFASFVAYFKYLPILETIAREGNR